MGWRPSLSSYGPSETEDNLTEETASQHGLFARTACQRAGEIQSTRQNRYVSQGDMQSRFTTRRTAGLPALLQLRVAFNRRNAWPFALSPAVLVVSARAESVVKLDKPHVIDGFAVFCARDWR